MTKKAKRTDIIFDDDSGRRHEYVFVHNLEDLGLSIEDAFVCWNVRTDELNAKSFKRYIESRFPFGTRIIIRSELIFKIADN